MKSHILKKFNYWVFCFQDERETGRSMLEAELAKERKNTKAFMDQQKVYFVNKYFLSMIESCLNNPITVLRVRYVSTQ